jgi:hypothetical protein
MPRAGKAGHLASSQTVAWLPLARQSIRSVATCRDRSARADVLHGTDLREIPQDAADKAEAKGVEALKGSKSITSCGPHFSPLPLFSFSPFPFPCDPTSRTLAHSPRPGANCSRRLRVPLQIAIARRPKLATAQLGSALKPWDSPLFPPAQPLGTRKAEEELEDEVGARESPLTRRGRPRNENGQIPNSRHLAFHFCLWRNRTE